MAEPGFSASLILVWVGYMEPPPYVASQIKETCSVPHQFFSRFIYLSGRVRKRLRWRQWGWEQGKDLPSAVSRP